MSGFGRGTAPCGHPGTCIVGSYIRCDQGCDSDGVPEYVEREKTECYHPGCYQTMYKLICAKCDEIVCTRHGISVTSSSWGTTCTQCSRKV